MTEPRTPHLSTDQHVELTTLWSRNQYLIEAFISSMVQDANDREDVLQETAKQVAILFHEYDTARPFANWAVGIARFKVRQCHDRRRKNQKVMGGEVLDQVAAAFTRVETDKAARIDAMQACVSKLKPRHRRLLDLRYIEEMGVESIAERVGVKPNTISVALYKIRAGLAQCIRRRLRLEARGTDVK